MTAHLLVICSVPSISYLKLYKIQLLRSKGFLSLLCLSAAKGMAINMLQIKAYFMLNIKILSKDFLPFLWSIILPLIFLLINLDSIATPLDLRFWWTYIVITSYIFGVGLHAISLKEVGYLKTSFSIRHTPFSFFVGNVLTQICYCLICLFFFNVLVSVVFSFSFIMLSVYSLITIIVLLPVSFLGYNLTLIQNVHVNTLMTLTHIILFILFMLMGTSTLMNSFNPLLYFSNVLVMTSFTEWLYFIFLSFLIVLISIPSIIKFSPVSTERR